MQHCTNSAASGSTDDVRGHFHRWLSVDQIRKMQRMRRTTVVSAMENGDLPFERRGRIRYARLADVLIWEQQRLVRPIAISTRQIRPVSPPWRDSRGPARYQMLPLPPRSYVQFRADGVVSSYPLYPRARRNTPKSREKTRSRAKPCETLL